MVRRVRTVTAAGWELRELSGGAFAEWAVLVSPGGCEFGYDNVISARADFHAVTGVEP